MALMHAQSNLINLKSGESELQALNYPVFYFASLLGFYLQ